MTVQKTFYQFSKSIHPARFKAAILIYLDTNKINNMTNAFFKILWFPVAASIFLYCSSQKAIQQEFQAEGTSSVRLPKNEKINIQVLPPKTDHFPEIIVKVTIKDDSFRPITNLAPPYGHLADWNLLWEPIAEIHPKLGQGSLQNFHVMEFQPELPADITDRSSVLSEAFQPKSVVLVMDVSGSMAEKLLEKAKRAALQFIDKLDLALALIVFNNQTILEQDFTSQKDSLRSSIRRMTSGGGTHLYDALHQAIDMLRKRNGQRYIIALTDGETSGDKYTLEQIVQFAHGDQANFSQDENRSVCIFPVGFTYQDENLEQLALQTGGSYYFADSAHELLSIFNRLSQQFASKFFYEVHYISPFANEDGKKRQLAFSFNNSIFSTAYTAPLSKKVFILFGKVYDDSTKEAISDAKITVKAFSSHELSFTHSTADGHYRLNVQRFMGRYLMYVEAAEYFISVSDTFLDLREKYELEKNFQLRRLKKDISVMLRMIYFKNNEYEIDPKSYIDLEIIAQHLKKVPNLKFEVSGHTDDRGTDEYNQWLSEKRAESVCNFFISQGILAQNMTHEGYGETRPLVPNISPLNRSQNRRVEIKIIDIPLKNP